MKEEVKNRIEFGCNAEGFLAVVNSYTRRGFYGPEYREYGDWEITPSRVFMKGDNKYYIIRYGAETNIPSGLFATLEECKSALESYVQEVNLRIKENNEIKTRYGVKTDALISEKDILVQILKVRYSKQCSIVEEL